MHDIGKTTALNSYSASYKNPSCVCAFVEECMKQEEKRHRQTHPPTHTHTHTHVYLESPNRSSYHTVVLVQSITATGKHHYE